MKTGSGTGRKLWPAIFWLLLWQGASAALGQPLLLPSPLQVAGCLWGLFRTAGYWSALALSTGRILGGFLAAEAAAAGLAALSARFPPIRELLSPAVAAIKAVPVASFMILVYLWLPGRWLPGFISALMVFPPVYLNLLEGLGRRDRQLAEMARVFRVPWGRRFRHLDLPQLLPYLRSATSLGLGLCWKAGIAAEVIGLPGGSLGERLYSAKVYFQTPDLFAWTAVIVAVSVAFEKLFLALVDALAGKAGC